MIDYHIHTQFSKDARQTMECVCKQAVGMGLKEICFTDHCDLNPSGQYFDFDLDYTEYTEEYARCKEIYGDKIIMKKGLEIGLQSRLLDKIEEFLKDKHFDFVLGSIHYVDRIDLFKENFYKSRSKKEAFTEYLCEVYECISHFDDFDCLGHLDVIRRYCPYDDKSMPLDEYSDIINKILCVLVDKGKGLEANIAAARYDLGNTEPSEDILKRYRELNGKYITLGSDSHTPDQFAIDRHKYLTVLSDCGFTHITSYSDRKPCLIPIDELL